MTNGYQDQIDAAKKVTPYADLIRDVLDPRIPKSFREHAAAREIERLRLENARLQAAIEDEAVTGRHNEIPSLEAEIEHLREWDAELVRTSTGSEWAFRLMDPPIGTKLFGFPPDAAGEIERLTMERDNARSIVEAATREGLLAQALADVKRLTEALREIDNRIDWEINPSNYDHDQVCRMNAEWCEVSDIAQAALNTEGKLT